MSAERFDKLAAMVLSWPEVRAHKLTVEEARLLGCCRICKRLPAGVPTTLSYGQEYACTDCLADEGWTRINRALESISCGCWPAGSSMDRIKSILEGKE